MKIVSIVFLVNCLLFVDDWFFFILVNWKVGRIFKENFKIYMKIFDGKL